MDKKIDSRNYKELTDALVLAQHTVYKRYLTELKDYPVVRPTEKLCAETAKDCIRFFQLEELSCKQGEDIFQKLSTVYHASLSLGCTLVVLVDVERVNAPAKIYLGVRNNGEDDEAKKQLGTSFVTLKNGMKSNFPGTKFHDIPSQEKMPELVKEIFGKHIKHIASVSCVASARDKSKTEQKSFVQGLEHFIDAMRGNAYTALFLAEPISTSEHMFIRSGYENLYSTLSSFGKSIWSYSENESESVMESLSKGVSRSITDGTSHTQAHTVNVGANMGMNSSSTNSHSVGQTTGRSSARPTAVSRTGQLLSGVSSAIGTIGQMAMVVNPLVGGMMMAGSALGSGVGGAMQGASVAESTSQTITDTIGKTIGKSFGLNAGYARTTSDGINHSETNGTSETTTKSETKTNGTGKTLQIENVNKPIEEMLKRIEEQLKRVQEGEDYGSYSCGAYFLSAKQESSLLAANTYRALMLGEGSSVESGAVNSWNGNEEPEKVEALKEYLCRFVHPIFALAVSENPESLDDMFTYTPGTTVSGLELPLHLGLPTRSVYGLPVLEHAEFGRNVTGMSGISSGSEKRIRMGNIYHMGQVEKGTEVALDLSKMSSHTFITGSTGAGKSNTVYCMLNRLMEKDIKFLVVEPAKGEYKDVFGGKEGVSVYGTNMKKTPLLRLNPFSFPEDIHILEHIDRLVEIFNACWPMYAAMPAVLKDAIEQAYIRKGWDMTASECRPRTFPTFTDLMGELPRIIQESAYSEDTKGDYIGSLVTRIKSLTNGMNGQIFCSSEEITGGELFDTNVIVDISRIGSMETKSLVMGILVMKLQEYRMSSGGANMDLQHVTVLEEAHHLLRRTSGVQTQESSNLQGKSVEMISNAIAEMRTYGEGFIIADQAPGLMDESAIRNTNTKIILRLPDESDRMLAGKSAALKEEQIEELARLPMGVAAIYQNDWLEAVLCQVDLFREKYPFTYNPQKQQIYFSNFFKCVFGLSDNMELSDESVEKIRVWINRIADEDVKYYLKKALVGRKLSTEEKDIVIYNLFEGKNLAMMLEKAESESAGVQEVKKKVCTMYGLEEQQLTDIICQRLLQIIFDLNETPQFRERYEEFLLEGRVF